MSATNDGLDKEHFKYLQKSIKSTPFYVLVGIELESLAPGRAVLKVVADRQHSNPMGRVHGGLLSTIADAAMGNAIRTLGVKAVTVDMSIAFTASASDGDNIIARGKVIKSGNNMIFTEAEVFTGDNIIAHAKGTFFKVGELEY